MSLKITHKNSTTAGTPPSAGDIDVGEIAMNAADAELYTKDTAGNIRKFQNTTTGTAAGVQFTQAGTGAVERTLESKLQDVVSVLDFIPESERDAIKAGTSTYDATAAFNAALRASETYGNSLKHICLQLGGWHYQIDGTVYVRKGQTIYGGGAHLYMGATGSIKLGYKSDNTEDAGGAPVMVSDLWIEGGLYPINSTINGYSVNNVFFSASAAGPIFRGTDGIVRGCTFDDGSTLAIVGGRNIALSDCVFYIGNNQLSINNAADIVITNCVFSYPNVAAISWEGNTGSILANTLISNCTFLKNAQSVATFKGFVYTLNNTAAPSGDLTISNCTFRNCYKSAITNHGTGSHRITIENCEFNGLKTYSVYSQSSTMYAVDMAATGFSGGHLILNNCKFRNLYETPIKLNSAQPYTVEVKNSVFANNGGTYEIEVTDGSSSSIIHLCNLEGDGTKDMFSVGTEPIDLRVSGYLKRWLLKKTSGSRNYVDLPFAGPTFWEVILTANPNPAGNGNYRALEANYVSVTYDYTSTGAMRVTDIEAFKGESPTLGFNMDVQAEIPTVGSGQTDTGFDTAGVVAVSWPSSYSDAVIDVQYKHTAKSQS
jgi:hypothetical protein